MAIEGYTIEVEIYQKLQQLKRRLYDDKPLTGEQRRDLANQLDAILHDLMEIR